MRLTAKIMAVFFVAVLLMTAVASYFSVRRAFDRFQQRQRAAALRLANEVKQMLEDRPDSPELRELQERLDELAALHDGDARLVDAEQLRREQPSWVGGAIPDADARVTITVRKPSGDRILRVLVPIEGRGRRQGGLELNGSLNSLDAETRDTLLSALASIGGIALLSVGTAYLAGLVWIARPLSQLIDKTRRAGTGDFSGPLQMRGGDELSQLGRALNEMCAQLARQQEKIHAETAERLATLDQLRHADRLKTVGRLAAGLAHELGTPLNVVAGRAALIASGKLAPGDILSSAETIKREADRITLIIRQLLDFARRRTPHRSPTNLRELIEQTTGLLAPIAEKRNVTLTVLDESDQGDGTGPVVIDADRNQLQQVFTNILMNAIQAMPDGGTVTIGLQRGVREGGNSTGWSAAVMITDQGVGISSDDLSHIFDPFFTTKDVGEGTGLGLSIVQGIVEEHGGKIDVQSEPGKGSCFTVYLP